MLKRYKIKLGLKKKKKKFNESFYYLNYIISLFYLGIDILPSQLHFNGLFVYIKIVCTLRKNNFKVSHLAFLI